MLGGINKFELIIFDLDGVLVDACEWHRLALNAALRDVCNYEIPLDEHYSTFNGIPTRAKLDILNGYGIVLPEQNASIDALKQQKTVEIINALATPRTEKMDLLQFLRARNMLIACYTNSIRHTTELMLRKTGILNMFHKIITNQDVEYPKPSPEGYIRCMNELQVPASKCAIVEDSPIGIQAATLSGATVIAVRGPEEVTLHHLRGHLL